jgi:hypothetical protein
MFDQKRKKKILLYFFYPSVFCHHKSLDPDPDSLEMSIESGSTTLRVTKGLFAHLMPCCDDRWRGKRYVYTTQRSLPGFPGPENKEPGNPAGIQPGRR